MVEMIPAITSNVKVDVAIVVVIGGGNPHRISFAFQSGALGHIFKCAVCFLVVEPVPKFGIAFVWHRVLRHRVLQQGSISEEDIHEPVVVVIKNRNAATHCLE